MDQNATSGSQASQGSLKRPNEEEIPFVESKKDIVFEKHKEKLTQNYTPVNPSELKFPNTDPVFVKKTWADKSLPGEFEATVRELLQNMNLENVVIVDVQCHGSLEKYVQIKTEQFNTNKTITTISGAVYDQPLFATTPDGCIGIFPAPLSSLNYASGNYKNEGVGYFLNPDNREQIITAIKTGNLDTLFEYIASRALNPEYETCGLGLPGCCPNYLLDFNPGVDSWAAFVATSEANPRNLRSLMKEKDTRSRTLLVASSTEKMEAPLLNDKYELFGGTLESIAAENNFKRTVKQNEGKIYVGEFFEIIKAGFPGKTILCFFDVCSVFFPSIIGNVKNTKTNTETIISFPIDQKLTKDKFNINDPLNKDPLNKDPDYIQLFQEYLTACDKFNTIRIRTIYQGIRFAGLNRPTFIIDYSPIVNIALKTTKKMFDVVKQSYKNSAVEDPSFRMGEMVKIQIDAESVFAATRTDTGAAISDSQPEDVGYLSIVKPLDSVVVCKPRGVFANVTQFVRNLLFKRQLGCNSISKYTLKPGEMDPIRDDNDLFAPSFSASRAGGGGGPDSNVNSSAAGGGGGPSAFRGRLIPNYTPIRQQSIETIIATNQNLSPEEIRLQRKGGSRKTKKNKTRRTKTRKTKKNKRNNAKTRKNKKTRR